MIGAAEGLSRQVGVSPACRALAVSRATLYRRRTTSSTPTVPTVRPTPPRALPPEKRQLVLDVLDSERFCDMAPAAVYANLLDEGKYHCSTRTMYRILSEAGEVKERRNQLRHPNYSKPELLATSPNQVWSWDITKLKGQIKWTYYYLYVLLDIFSRYVVGWMIAMREAGKLAERLIEETYEKQGITPGQVTVHADRGTAAKSLTVAQKLTNLGLDKTFTRPHTPTDNPYSEAHFKTMKYQPEFPTRFGCFEDAHSFCRGFFNWYNTVHRHSGIAYLTPEMVHCGHAADVINARRVVLKSAYEAHPERFVNKKPAPAPLPEAVWINKPEREAESEVVLH